MTYVYTSNNDHTVETSAAKFLLVQRNGGYADNDGRWVVSQLSELYWSPDGVLRRRNDGRLLGIFDTLPDAMTATGSAERMPDNDQMVR